MAVDVGNVPAVITGGTGTDNYGMGGMWMIALVFIALLGFRGNGFGGGAEGNAETNGRFNLLENRIDNINDMAELRATHKEVCDSDKDLLNAKFELSREIEQNRFDTALGFKNAEIKTLETSCATNRNIDSLRVEGERNTQRILDEIRKEKIESLQAKVVGLESAISQIRQTEHILGAIRRDERLGGFGFTGYPVVA